MGQSDDQTGDIKVPDTATSYERSKPEQQSPSKSLERPATNGGGQKDKLSRNEQPSSPKDAH